MSQPTSEQTDRPINGDKLSFTVRTLIQVAVQCIIVAWFFSQMDSRLKRVEEIVTDQKTEQRANSSDQNLRNAKMEAEIATINVRLAIIENQLHMNQQSKP